MHWSELAEAHAREVVPRIDPTLDEPSMLGYLARTYLLRFSRPGPRSTHEEDGAVRAGRGIRRAQAEAEAV